MTPIHNNKQNKVPLREEGVDFSKVKGNDRFLWVEGMGNGNRYADFGPREWDMLNGGQARL